MRSINELTHKRVDRPTYSQAHGLVVNLLKVFHQMISFERHQQALKEHAESW